MHTGVHRYWLTGRAPPGVPATIPPPGAPLGGTSPGHPGALPLHDLLPSSSMYYSQKNRLANSIMYHLSIFLPYTTYSPPIVYSLLLYCIAIPSSAYLFRKSSLDTFLSACSCTIQPARTPATPLPLTSSALPLFHPSSLPPPSAKPYISLLSWHLRKKSEKISKRVLTR